MARRRVFSHAADRRDGLNAGASSSRVFEQSPQAYTAGSTEASDA